MVEWPDLLEDLKQSWYILLKGLYFCKSKRKTQNNQRLSHSPCFTLRLEKSQDVSFSHWALHVSDDGPVGGVADELDSDLDATTLGSGTSENLCDLGLLDFGVHVCSCLENQNKRVKAELSRRV